MVRFYFDDETKARLELPLNELFTGSHPLFGPEFSYISGTGGNLHFPIPYENLFFTITPEGWMTSRLVIPFRNSLTTAVYNAGMIAYTVEFVVGYGTNSFTDKSYHLHAQWGTNDCVAFMNL